MSLVPRPTALGSILTSQSLITHAQLSDALALQRRHGGRLGEILTHYGHISVLALHRAIAQHYHLSFIDLSESPPDPHLLDPSDLRAYLHYRVLPWRKRGIRLTLAASEITEPLLAWIKKRYGSACELVITSPLDIRWAIERHFGTALDHISRNLLHSRSPHQSARTILPPAQKHGLAVIGAVGGLLILLYPWHFLVGLFLVANVFYAATILFKLLLFLIGGATQKLLKRQSGYFPPIADKDLPIYTVLIPLYKEADSLPHLLPAIRNLDYPKSKLDVKLIVEADDEATVQAAMQLKPEGMFDIIRVPYSLPRTKPKACNYALKFARGEFVTIYDAEDRPAPCQLRKAVQAFRAAPKNIVCLQARLNYYNRNDNLLTKLFAIEYAAWFDYMLPGLEALEIPIPLGGTSNHIALAKLREIGEWDPYNVTEDADLGIRLAISSYRTAMVDSITLEEAPSRMGAWMRQRARWIKGYMQTWLVHMRDPLALYRSFRPRAFWGFQFFVGGPCMVFLLTPVMWLLTLAWAVGWFQPPNAILTFAGPLALFNLIMGFVAHFFFSYIIVNKGKWPKMLGAMLTFPFYWLLHSLASLRALWQLIRKPHHWDKTSHTRTGFEAADIRRMIKEFIN